MRAEREAGEEDGKAGQANEVVERGAHVFDLAAPFIVGAFTEAGTAKVEAQNRKAEVRERFHCVVDDLVVHCARTADAGAR